MKVKINIVQAKSVFIKSGLPASDWVINPYNGCLFACMYCYASSIARWKHPGEEWGSFLDVKINASELLKSELEKSFKKTGKKDFGSIFFSSVTDPYNGMEAKYHLTRKCLEVLADFGYKGLINVQTKSPLVIEDIDVIKRLKNVEVSFTVTTLDDKVSRFLEVKAPSVSSRIDALEKLHKAGIKTYAFVGPILPYFINSRQKIKELLYKLEQVGVSKVWFEHMHMNALIKHRLFEYLKKESPELISEFEKADTQEYRDKLNKIIYEEMKGRKIKLAYGEVIHHRELPKKK
jgi:DNA repair photolyase